MEQVWRQVHRTRRSAVLALLVGNAPDFRTLLTIRSKALSFGGDAALPGGKADTEQESVWDVALREANEEIGLNPKLVHKVAMMPGYLSANHLLVVPVVGYMRHPPKLPDCETSEVHKIFTAELSKFLPNTTKDLQEFNFLSQKRLPGDPLYDKVWGLTAHILIDLARVALQREPEFKFYRGRHLMAEKNAPIGGMQQVFANMDILKSERKPSKHKHT